MKQWLEQVQCSEAVMWPCEEVRFCSNLPVIILPEMGKIVHLPKVELGPCRSLFALLESEMNC